ncbi:MAG TPA: polysaccharide biosynthesis/export family protein [Pyrinomonadaceae bacterium]|jgi:protein involved in polysaccharide export with SLBB domain
MRKFLPAIALVLAFGAQLSAVRAQATNVSAALAVQNSGSATPDGTAAKPEKEVPEKTEEAHKTSAPSPATTPASTPTSTTAAAAATTPGNTDPSATGAEAPAAKPVSPVPSPSPQTSPSQAAAAATTTTTATPVAPAVLTNIYRVGVGDVLDIRLLNANRSESTLFTVMEGGLLEYPLAGDPVQVAGKTAEEISTALVSKIKIYEKPQVVVSVRQYASHSVIVTGLVFDPGTKALRREAVPLYVLLAEAQPRPEAAQATIRRTGSPVITVDLSDATASATLVYPGDVVTLAVAPPKPPQFYFIGGQIHNPGQKDFHAGITLTQAILASGGVSRFAGSKVKVSRQGPDGRLVATEYNLKQIENGKVPDPLLQPGDRVEITKGGW